MVPETMATRNMIIYLLICLAITAEAAYQGCYTESVRRRHFSVNPGGYNPEVMTVLMCTTSCGMFSFQYAGVTSGKFCYCANQLPTASKVADSECDTKCAGDTGQSCGGALHVSVFTATIPITGLSLKSDAEGTIIPVGQPVRLDVSISSGNDVIYRFDYDDGSAISSPNASSMLITTYHTPGEYTILVYATDLNKTLQDQVAATTVRAEAPPGPVEIQCDPVFGTFQEGVCNCTVWAGSSMTLAVTVHTMSLTLSIEDPPLSLAGPAVNVKVSTAGDGRSAVYLLHAAEFSVVGRILGWELVVFDNQAGTSLQILLLKPACSSGSYCYSSNSCSTTSCTSPTSRVTSCPAGDQFCVQAASCQSACSAPASRYTVSSMTYEVVKVMTVQTSGTGSQFVEETQLMEVQPGYILGIQQGAAQAVLNRLACPDTTQCDLQSTSQTAPEGSKHDFSSATKLDFRHAVRAVASAGSQVYLPLTFDTAGNFSLKVEASSSTLTPSSMSSNMTEVVVLEGINATIITAPQYGATGDPVTFTVEPHTGNNVFYNWTFSDASGVFLAVTDRIKTHAFSTKGNYSVNVTAYNAVSEKNNLSEITIQDKVAGLALTAEPTALGQASTINLTMTDGSDYTCSWDFGDLTARVQTGEASTPKTLTSKQHTYRTTGDFLVVVSCSNQVSSVSQQVTVKVLEAIKNLLMVSSGAQKGEAFTLDWHVDAGTDVTCVVMFDGVNLPSSAFSSVSKYLWRSSTQLGRAASSIPLSITCTNLVSRADINLNFQILSVIVSPTLTTEKVNLSSHEPVNFTVNMLSGSDVTVLMDYGDSDANNYTQPPGVEWDRPHNMTHMFTNGGRFTVTATIYNAAGSHRLSVQVLVLVGVGAIDCQMVDYALYHPPAYVNLTLNASVMPTEPTFTLNWGEPQSQDINPGPLQINMPYTHTFGDTGTFTVKANITNLLGHKMCIKPITIVEKLSGPYFQNKFAAAAKGMPYLATFCLYRGPSSNLCNLTYNFGDGSGDQVFQRLGSGKDGCDTHDVIYTDTTSKVITVTATSHLETVSAQVTVPVIIGLRDTDVVNTSTGSTFNTPTTFTLTNNAAQMPDNAFIKFEFGDGSTAEESLRAAAQGGRQQIAHTYTKDGLFEAKVIVYNQATAVEKIMKVGVFQTFLNLRAEVFYLADTPPAAVTYGLNGRNNLFPSNKPVHFRVSDSNQAFATDYQLTITNSLTAVAASYTFTSPEFNVTVSQSGQHTYDITAKNPRDSAVFSSSLEVIELIEGFNIIEVNAKVKANEAKVFSIRFIAVGTDTCLYIDFGDGSKSIFSDVSATCSRADFSSVPAADRQGLTGLTQLQHVYTSEGFYTLNATAVNSQSWQTYEVGFSITGMDCSKPTVDIHNRRANFAFPAVQKRNERISLQGLSNIFCVQSYENVKSWRAEHMNESYNTVISDVPLTGLLTTIAELNIPPLFLKPGLYRFFYSMEMKGAYGSNRFQSETYTYIKVIPSDLVGVMMKGSPTWIQRGQAQTLVLDPLEHSLDQDLEPTSVQGLAVSSWSCERLDNSSTECAAAGFSPAGQSQTLTLSALQIDQTYRFTAVLWKDTRATSTTIYVTIVAGNPPVVSILPLPGSVFYQLPTGYKILKSSRFAMDCSCTSCTAADVIDYVWTVYLDDYRWPNSWRVLEPSDLDGRVLGATSKQISIQTSLFDLFAATKMRLECLARVKGQSGNVSVQLEVNRPPVPGTCLVSPLNRTITTETAWRLVVDGWTDDDGISEYQFFTHVDANTVDKQVTSVQTSRGHYELNVSLSEGPDYNHYQQLVVVKARDIIGATQIWECGTVLVRPIPVGEIRAIAKNIISNQLHEMKRMFAEGDQQTCIEKSTNLVSLLNSDKYAGQDIASNFVGSMYGSADDGRPSYRQQNASVENAEIEYKMETERNDRAAVRSLLIREVTRQTPQSLVGVQQQCSFLAEVMIFGDEISQESQRVVIDALDKMTEFLSDPKNTANVPSEELEIVLKNMVAISGEMYDSLGNNGYYGLRSDLENATKDELFPMYDTNIDSMGGDDDFSAADSYEEALKWHIARINRLRQEKVAQQARAQLLAALDQQVACFSRFSVAGQTLECNSLKMKQVMEKTSVDQLSGMQLSAPGSSGGVVFPNISILDGVDSTGPVVVSVSQSTNYPLRYSDSAKGISPYSSFISISLYSANNTKLSVQNLTEPMTVTIPADANLPEPSYINTSPIIASWSTLMTYVVNLTRPQSAIHMDFKNIEGKQLLLVVKLGKLASIAKDPAHDECDYVSLLPLSMATKADDKNRYRFYINNTIIGNFTGMVSIGVRELNSTEMDMDISAGCASLPRYPNGSNYFTGNYSLRIFVTQCLVMSDTSLNWTTDGCVVGIDTTVFQTVCYCTHLTTFAGGWVVVPNTIDWSYVFAHADFLTNPTIYITVIVTGLLYIIFAILARYKDKKLAQKLGIAPLPDNDPRDKYFYEILVSTGMRRNAGTDSQVCFILSGEDDETDVRAFSDSKRKIFRRGQVDGFLMAVPRPLGYLNFIRVWHDNSGRGKFGSWYLNYLMIRDIQTDVKQLFIANKWFAVEEEDGQVDRVIPVANREQMADFSYQFGERSKKDFADGHLWFSVVARPANSRFTCLQRVSCCLCLLYLTMLTNAMFYNTTSSQESASNSFTFGPFSLSPEEIFIGVISNLIVFPVNFLLVFLFKKSRPHHKRPSRIDLAIKEVYDQNRQTNLNDIKPEVSSIFSIARSPCLPKDPHGPDTSVSRPGTAMSNTSTEELTPKKKKKKFELPWYFTIIAWLLLWVVTLGSLAMVIFYGISFKDEICKKWITSMIVSFFMSVFVTQPIKVIMFAIILSLIVKNPGEEEEDEEEDEELPHIDQDSELLHAIDLTRPRKIGYKPPDPQLLEKLREKRLKEIKMWEIIREVIIYSFFLWILMVISYRQMGASNFLYKNTMYKVFIDNKNTDIDFNAIRNADEFWIWARSGMVNGIRAGAYYNDYPPLKLRAYINDKVSRILGYATMRQLRIKPSQCEVPEPVQGLVPECNVNYYMFDQQEATFRPGWQPMRPGDTTNDTKQEYIYTTAKDLNGYPYWGILSWYSGGGYVVNLKAARKELVAQLDQLEQDKWIDRYTRAVFVEFTVYNPQVNLFAIGTILAEFHPSGGLVASARFEPAMLLPYMTSAMLFQIICEIIYILFVLFFIVRELRELIKMKMSYFRSFWNMVEVGVIAMSIAAIVIFFYRMVMTNELTTTFKKTLGNGYVKFQYVAYWNETFSYMIGFLCFLATIKFLKLLRFNRKMSMLSATLKFSAWSLFNFGIIFLIVFLAFAQLFYLTFMHIDIDYATFVSSMVSGILMMMGRYDIYSMIMAEPVLTQIFVLLFVITVTFILVNMFVTILNETFAAVREDINKQGNDYEIVDFMMLRFKQWTGLGKPEDHTLPAGGPDDLNNLQALQKGDNSSDHVENFPDRIERLLKTISSVYMDNDNLAMLYQKKPYESQHGNKNLLRTGLSPTPASKHRRKDSSDAIARVQTH